MYEEDPGLPVLDMAPLDMCEELEKRFITRKDILFQDLKNLLRIFPGNNRDTKHKK